MKLLFTTHRYGDRIMISPGYGGRAIFFAGEKQPRNQQLITVELPGLAENSEAAIFGWLDEHTAVSSPSPHTLYELPAANWRPATLEDFLDAENYENMGWWLHEHFLLDDFSRFADKWLPPVQEQIRQALALAPAETRVDRLHRLHQRAERIFTVVARTPDRIERERDGLIRVIEKELVAQLRQEPFAAARWIETAASLHTTSLISKLLIEVTETLARRQATQADFEAALTQIYRSPELRSLTQHAEAFWQPLKHAYRLAPTVTGQTIDITTARVQLVNWGWELINGRRVGRIVPGRQALVIQEGDDVTYIAGGRDIKFKVQQHGRIRRHGCTLVMDDEQSGLYTALLEIERLDILANVAPQEAVAGVADLDLPPDHAVYQAAAAAEQDPRQARVLADLLIELTVGIDADVARRLVRGQTGRRGRRFGL
jgi:hypothetical protein